MVPNLIGVLSFIKLQRKQVNALLNPMIIKKAMTNNTINIIAYLSMII